MAKIKFVRKYETPGGYECFDVCYETMRLYFYFTREHLPKTAERFMDTHDCVKQYDSIYKRDEYIYQ